MRIETPSLLRRRQRGITPVGLALGFLVGVLIATMLVPRTTHDQATSSGGASPIAEAGTALGTPGTAPDTGVGGGSSGTTGPGGAAAASSASGATPTSTVAAASTGAAVRGVTDNLIKIGVVYPRTDNLEAIDKNNYGGDGVKLQEAVVDRWRREGRLPVNGRDIKFVYYQVDFLNPTDQRNACVKLVQDEKVFAVIGAGLGTGRSCVAQEYHTPIIADDWGGLTTDAYLKANAPYLFSTPMSTSRLMRNWVHWADQGGYLKGKTIGFYYVREDGPDPDGLANAFEGEMTKLGYKIAAKQSTDSTSYAGPDDQVAVQKFRSAGVNLAMLVLGPRMSQFMQDADAQGYKPTYLDNDYILTTRDMHANSFPPSQFEGTYAMTDAHMGEWSTGLSPQSKACRDNYTRYSGEQVPGPNVEYEDILITCDISEALIRGLEAAGRELTPASFIHGLETNVKDVKGALYGDFSFSPTKHDGADSWRTIQWHSDCQTATTHSCWKIVGDGQFRPFWTG